MTLTLFASVATSLEKEAEDELRKLLTLSMPMKRVAGHVLFTPAATMSAAVLACALSRARTIDYVFVLLASTTLSAPSSAEAFSGDACGVAPLEPGTSSSYDDASLQRIYTACAAMPRTTWEAALALWREFCQISDDQIVAQHATIAEHALVFRSKGKRGGRGHSFSSDDAKRAAVRGLKAATALNGSTSTYHLDVLAQVHNNNFWFGLRLNPGPLSDMQGGDNNALNGGEEGAVGSRRAMRLIQRRKAHLEQAEVRTDDERPPLLDRWLRSRLQQLGLHEVRDVRDAAAPLWEMALAEQRARKRREMVAVVVKLTQPPQTSAASHVRHMREHGQCAVQRDKGSDRAPVPGCQCEPLLCVPPAAAKRNKCEMHLGRDREGAPCCGFRLGLGASADARAVGAVTAVPFVPAWMCAAADALTRWLRQHASLPVDSASEVTTDFNLSRTVGSGNVGVAALAAGNGCGKDAAMGSILMRGSERTRRGVVVLSLSAGSEQLQRSDELARALLEAAAAHGMALESLLLREGCAEGTELLGTGGDGSYEEHLSNGLRMRVSADAFFQTCTTGAELLFDCVLRHVCGPYGCDPLQTVREAEAEFVEVTKTASTPPHAEAFPALVIDACCGGGALGLWVAHAAAAAGARTQVVGIEMNAACAADAKANIERNGLARSFEVVHAKVEDALGATLKQLRCRSTLSPI